ncbi:MAG: 3-deoxy-7-phosphoheptulonate synthase [Saprospiraceae bacterium]|nr:3-deoxy-7-phosphoheptulonate synthase [Saprospiraceae bacterium]MBP7643576.1 3-deoxy-7-phosphoheptulonate synthase [Saprospiraceae bacterium]
MIIKLKQDINASQHQSLASLINNLGYKPTYVNTQFGKYLVCIGKKEIDLRKIGFEAGVEDIFRVDDAYKLVSSQWKIGKTVIDLGDDVKIGGNDFQIMVGPCSIEGEEQIASTIAHMKLNGVKIMRGGVFKPRSSPYSFRGHGIDTLKLWSEMAKKEGIKIITEVMQVSQIEEMMPYVDIFQVGARNSQNFNLLDELGKVDKPVMLKRGISGTIEELLQSAEYIFSNGNEKILLCERGIRSYETAYRNTMDINAIAILKDKSHLPVIADPSHGIGVRRYVDKIALASVAAGADGVIMEVHECPEKAVSDGQQTLDYGESAKLIAQLSEIRKIIS